MNRQYPILKSLVLASVFALTACDNSSDTGNLTLAITDAPIDGAQSVVVTFNAVEVKKSGGNAETITFSEPQQIDLLNLSGTNSVVLLNNEPLSAGEYEWMRLSVDDDPTQTYIIDSMGNQHDLTIPSSANTGLKLNRSFSIAADGNIAFTIDFDLRKSVHMTSAGAYSLRPTLRIVETALAASLSGTVDNSLVTPGCSPGVYLFNEGDVVDDLDGTDDAIFSIALPEQGPYDYSAGFLPAGNYTIAFTCEANQDANDSDDVAVTFSHETVITLAAGEDGVFNFAP